MTGPSHPGPASAALLGPLLPRTEGSLVDATLASIEQVLAGYRNPLVGYSGGKDGLVVHHLVNRVRPTPGYCEASFYFRQQVADIEATIDRLGFDVQVGHRLTYRWLADHSRFMFSDDNKLRQHDARLRQQTGVQLMARRGGHDLMVWGRRVETNTVPSVLYETRKGPQFHPIRDWTTEDVWRYIDEEIGIPRPWIYTTPFGPLSGNAAFYSFRLRQVDGDLARAWALVDSLDPQLRPRYEAARARD